MWWYLKNNPAKKINPCSPTWSHHFFTSISTSASFWIFELDHQENHNKQKEKSDVSALVTRIVCNTIYAINLFTAPSPPPPPSTHFKTKNMHGTRMWVADGTMSTYEKMKPNQNTGFCQDVVHISYKKYRLTINATLPWSTHHANIHTRLIEIGVHLRRSCCSNGGTRSRTSPQHTSLSHSLSQPGKRTSAPASLTSMITASSQRPNSSTACTFWSILNLNAMILRGNLAAHERRDPVPKQ